MAGLNLNHFISAGNDLESAQYRILGGIQDVKKVFARNAVYPELGEIIDLYDTLNTVLQRGKDLKENLPRRLKNIDIQEGKLVYEQMTTGDIYTELLEDLISWALPHVQGTIEEGRTLYDFVEENLHVEEVGIVPLYVEEGYLFVPDRLAATIHVFEYNLSLITRADERYRSLKTSYVKSINRPSLLPRPQAIKLELLSEYRHFANPATFYIDVDFDFPFEQTILPIAKRKLMQYLCSRGGTA